MKTRSLFMIANRHFIKEFSQSAVAQITVFCERHLAKSGDQAGAQSARIQVRAGSEMPSIMCTLCLKPLTLISPSESSDHELLDHTCGGDVSKAVSVLFDDQWIAGETRDFHRVWASNAIIFTRLGISEPQALEARERLLRREIAQSREDEDFYSNSPYYTRRWRDDFLEHKLASGYVFEGGIDKCRWAKN
jgi:hypothetical protein